MADPSAFFQAGELEGEVVGIQRLRPIAEGLVYYGGLRVDAKRRRQGLGRTLLRAAIEQSRQLGFREMRLATGVEAARGLFETEGFRLQLEIKFWRASRLEGGEPPARLRPGQADAAFARLRDGPDLATYRHLLPDPERPLDLDGALFKQLSEDGWVRVGAGGQALAVAGPFWDAWGVLFLAGQGAALQDLLLAIRFEADAEGLDVRLLSPDPHPAEEDFTAAGYGSSERPARFYFYSLLLS